MVMTFFGERDPSWTLPLPLWRTEWRGGDLGVWMETSLTDLCRLSTTSSLVGIGVPSSRSVFQDFAAFWSDFYLGPDGDWDVRFSGY